MEGKGGAIQSWNDIFSCGDWTVDMPDATDSEFRQGAEYNPWYPLDPSLPKIQVLNVNPNQTLTETL